MLAITKDVNLFYRMRLVVFQDLAGGEEGGFNAWACYDAKFQGYTNLLESNRATEWQIMKGDFNKFG